MFLWFTPSCHNLEVWHELHHSTCNNLQLEWGNKCNLLSVNRGKRDGGTHCFSRALLFVNIAQMNLCTDCGKDSYRVSLKGIIRAENRSFGAQSRASSTSIPLALVSCCPHCGTSNLSLPVRGKPTPCQHCRDSAQGRREFLDGARSGAGWDQQWYSLQDPSLCVRLHSPTWRLLPLPWLNSLCRGK